MLGIFFNQAQTIEPISKELLCRDLWITWSVYRVISSMFKQNVHLIIFFRHSWDSFLLHMVFYKFTNYCSISILIFMSNECSHVCFVDTVTLYVILILQTLNMNWFSCPLKLPFTHIWQAATSNVIEC